MLGGKLAAEVVSDRAAGIVSEAPLKEIHSSVFEKASLWKEKEPTGVLGEGAIAWGGGSDMNAGARKLLETSDPQQLVDTGVIPTVVRRT